ncbi:MAG TPA: PfkB family carbohydrate kinase [Pseudonocardia sp.]|nr:PfkB family carbohydrate kinase [Pseudonocardia sp.]
MADGVNGAALCVGLTTLDVIHHVDEPLRPGTKQRCTGGELIAGGPAANAAVTAARLLGSARLVTAVGDGPAAAPVLSDLYEHRVEVLDVATGDWPVPVATALVDVRTGERTVISPGATGAGGAPVPRSGLTDVLAGIRVVLLDGHHPALGARVAALAAQAGIPVLLDAGSWKDDIVGLLPRVGVAACSADFQPPGARRAGDDPWAAATVLHRHGVPTVLVTDGPNPVVWSTIDGDRGSVAVPAVRALDTLGAGDAFHGALAAAYAVGARSLRSVADFAAQVASVRCSVLGNRAWLADPALRGADARLRAMTRRAPAR